MVLSVYLYWTDKKTEGILMGREQNLMEIEQGNSTDGGGSIYENKEFKNKNIKEQLLNPASSQNMLNLWKLIIFNI